MASSETTTGEMPRMALRYRIEGMDCSSCALKIENAVEQFSGAEDVQANYQAQVLEFQLDETITPRVVVEEQIRKLGYGVVPPA